MKTLAFAAALALSTPAVANTVSISLTPASAQEAQALRLGLALYALHNDIDANGHVTQSGAHNAAAIAQGATDHAIIHQEGTGHSGAIQQTGGNNAYGLFQFGKKTRANVVQKGTGKVGTTVQWGW